MASSLPVRYMVAPGLGLDEPVCPGTRWTSRGAIAVGLAPAELAAAVLWARRHEITDEVLFAASSRQPAQIPETNLGVAGIGLNASCPAL